jgi:undecaprenyl diphosphate synthase
MSDQSTSMPLHLGLILDGNRRWAKAHKLPLLEGHRKGYANLKKISEYAINKGVKYVSAYIFSTENWNRTEEEVSYLMDLAYWVATKEVEEIHKKGIRVRFLGSREKLSSKIIKAIENAEEKTKNNKVGTLALCFNYGGHQEIVDATKNIIKQGIAEEDVTEELIEQNLYSGDIPSIDLLIRTSGEQRTSGFMLWRSAYSELLFTDTLWPDFDIKAFDEAVLEYNSRERRFGK